MFNELRFASDAQKSPGFISLSLSDGDCDKITSSLLKSRTGEFDLESILFLKLRGLGKSSQTCRCLVWNNEWRPSQGSMSSAASGNV